MARTRRDTRRPLIEALEESGYAFDFYQAVRVLEALDPKATPVGEGTDPSLEAVRFRSDPSLAFPVSAVVEVDPTPKKGGPGEVTVSFLGLSGAQGPLPRPFAELLLRRLQDEDPGIRDFLDIFNHRLVSLQYRAREKHRQGLRIQPPEESRVARMAFALMGLGQPALRERREVPDRSLLAYAGILSHGRRTATGLEGVLTHFFGALLEPADREHPSGEVRVHEFVGRWFELEADQITQLGRWDACSRLGVDAVLGGRVWDPQAAIEVAVGPLDFDVFLRFLPGGDAAEALSTLVDFYLRGEVGWTLRPILREPHVPSAKLSTAPGATRLGWTSWLGERSHGGDGNEVALDLTVARSVTIGGAG